LRQKEDFASFGNPPVEATLATVEKLKADNYKMARLLIKNYYESEEVWGKSEWKTQTWTAISDPNSFVLVEVGTQDTSLIPKDWEVRWNSTPEDELNRAVLIEFLRTSNVEVQGNRDGTIVTKRFNVAFLSLPSRKSTS
jgi:hypothetical protein